MNRLFSLNLSRALIRCTGAIEETTQFLQGLVTNDVRHLTGQNSCIYAMFLNRGGRVLYDSIIYKTSSESSEKVEFLIECDSSAASSLANIIKLYRVRKKIDISVSDEHDIWCLQGEVKQNSTNFKTFIDPRLKALGMRIIAEKGLDVKNKLDGTTDECSLDEYTTHRYKHGVGEGVVDLLPEKSFPLESNCDYLHGISFHKGCYIGQELTARTHHTGVIRKRLMPLIFDKSISFKSNATEPVDVKNESGISVGKIRNIIDKTGLGLMRIDPALAAKELNFNSNIVKTRKPEWWPVEAEKSPQLPKQ